MILSNGARIGPYEIRSPLGAGGMGEVYLASDTKLHRQVALKVLPPAVEGNDDRIARFMREAQVLASLNHPNIAQIYGIEEAGNVRALVMEFIDGRTLDAAIPKDGVSPIQFFDIAIALADALHGAHQKHVIHRDLKPANIMFTNDGRVKILDFGLAHVTQAASEDAGSVASKTALTEVGTIIGTVPYMSPEQVQARELDHRSDLFSLGVILYEMVMGQRPFVGETSADLIASILREHPHPVSQTRSDIPDETSQLIARCLEKDRANRPQTAQEILIELKLQRRICESGGIRVKPMAESRLRITGTKMAVLPFTCRAGHAESEDLASGLTEDIAAGLARFRYLSVIAKSQSGARYLLEGSVRHSATAVRVTARLVDADTGAHLWADSYTRDSQGADLFALQDDIASRIVATVADSAGVLVRAIGGPLRERPCDQLSIDELILRWLLFVQNFDGAERERLLAAFENALKREPGHADAWAALAGLHNLAYVNSPDRPPELLERLHAAAKRALDLDPFCLRGWFGLAIWSVHTHDHAGMLTAVQRAIALNPWDSTALAGIARLHAFVGDYEDAVANAHRAMELNAHHPEWYKIPLLFDACRRRAYDEALQIVKRLAAPHERLMTAFHIAILGNLQHREEAIGALDALAMHSPAWLDTQRVRGLFAFAISDQQLLADLVDGFVKAKILADIS